MVATSKDNGTTFKLATVATGVPAYYNADGTWITGGPGSLDLPRTGDRRESVNDHLFVAFSGGAIGSYCGMYGCYTNDESFENLWVSNSTNGGKNWSNPVPLGDTLLGINGSATDPNYLFTPSIGVGSNGNVFIDAAFVNDSVCSGTYYCGLWTNVLFESTNNGSSFSNQFFPYGSSADVSPYPFWDGVDTSMTIYDGNPFAAWTWFACPVNASMAYLCEDLSDYGYTQVVVTSLAVGPGVTVSFNETGLPTGYNWSISLSGNARSGPSNTTLSVSGVPIGRNQTWAIGPVATSVYGIEYTGIATTPPPGSFSGNATINVTFLESALVIVSTVPSAVLGHPFYCGGSSSTAFNQNCGNENVTPGIGPQWVPVGSPFPYGVYDGGLPTNYCYGCYNYTFLSWTGTGPGSWNSSVPNGTTVISGPGNETASFSVSSVCYLLPYYSCFALVYSYNFTEIGPAYRNELDGDTRQPDQLVHLLVSPLLGRGWAGLVHHRHDPLQRDLLVGGHAEPPVTDRRDARGHHGPLQPRGQRCRGVPRELHGKRGSAQRDGLGAPARRYDARPSPHRGVHLPPGRWFGRDPQRGARVRERRGRGDRRQFRSDPRRGRRDQLLARSRWHAHPGRSRERHRDLRFELLARDPDAGGRHGEPIQSVGRQRGPSHVGRHGAVWLRVRRLDRHRDRVQDGLHRHDHSQPAEPGHGSGHFRANPDRVHGDRGRLRSPGRDRHHVPPGVQLLHGVRADHDLRSGSGNVHDRGPHGRAERYCGRAVRGELGHLLAAPRGAPAHGPGGWVRQYRVPRAVPPDHQPDGERDGVPVAGSYWENAGTGVTITATPATGYLLVGWVGTGSGSYNGTSLSTTITPTGPVSEGVSFALYIAPVFMHTLVLTPSGLPSNVVWSASIGGTAVTGTGALTFTLLNGTYTVDVGTVSPMAGVEYVPSVASFSVTVTGNTPYSGPTFTTMYLVTISGSSGGTAGPTSLWTTSGSSITLSAVAGAGDTFVSWNGTGTGSYTGTTASSTVTVTGPISEFATFVPTSSLSKASTGSGGSDTLALGLLVALLVVGLVVGLLIARSRPPSGGGGAEPAEATADTSSVPVWSENAATTEAPAPPTGGEDESIYGGGSG